MSFKDKLLEAKSLYRDMTEIVNACENYKGDCDLWSVLYEDFFETLRSFPFMVNTYDFDQSCKEDIMNRYNQIKDFMKGFEE